MKKTHKEPIVEERTGDNNEFGNWPELVGVVLTAIATWMIFEFRG